MLVWLVILCIAIIGSWGLDLLVESLNLKRARMPLPDEFRGVYDEDKYRQSQQYLRETTRFGLLHNSISTVAMLLIIFFGGFNYVDRFARRLGGGEITTGLVFVGSLILLAMLANLPFSYYSTFVIEEKYGFNKTTLRTFIGDRVKGILLAAIIGAPIFAGIIWFFEQTQLAWFWAWLAFTAFQLLLMFLVPVVVLPLFNKFTPLPDGELKDEILSYAQAQNFALQGVFQTDGSKRSTKANAYFTGFGRFRRIALFDTLIQNHSVAELVAILAHEMGHFKLRHIHKLTAVSIGTTGLMFFVFSLLIRNEDVFQAFGVEQTSIYASLVFIAILFGPIELVFGVLRNRLSCRFEFQADSYAATTCDNGSEHLITALKNLTVENLGNLTPHPLKVFLEYSHPPVLDRIRALRCQEGEALDPD